MVAPIDIYAVGTETFYNNYGKSKLDSMQNYAKDIWKDSIEDGSGDYYAEFLSFGSSDVEIPETSLCDSCTTRERMNDADDWLYYNWDHYPCADVIIISDYYGYDDKRVGVAQQTAGTDFDKCCLVDVYEAENKTDVWSDGGSEAFTAHELLHMFLTGDDEHDPYGVYDKQQDEWQISVMYSNTGVNGYCGTEPSETDKVVKDASFCTQSNVRDWIDNNRDVLDDNQYIDCP